MTELIGYLDQIAVGAGDTLNVMASTDADTVQASVVRLLRARDANDGVLPLQSIDSVQATTFPGRQQTTLAGSYAVLPLPEDVFQNGHLSLRFWLYPTLPASGNPQVVAALDTTLTFRLDPSGHAELVVEGGTHRSQQPLTANHWYEITINWTAVALELQLNETSAWTVDPHQETLSEAAPGIPPGTVEQLILATSADRQHPFNGKIERPRVFASEDSPVADWDFNEKLHTNQILDMSSNACHGHVYNTPMRGCTGHRWDGSAQKPGDNPDHYGAIHFHEDDITDAEWDVDLSLQLPADLESGTYAVRLSADGAEDFIPFFVRPATKTQNEILFLAPTNTYLAYANERMAHSDLELEMGHPLVLDPYDDTLAAYPELGKSVYDLRRDGSGSAYSSRLRPVLNMRPDYRTWINAGARHFAADLFIVGWLEQSAHGYDTATDEDLHRDGAALLDPYKVLVTGTHPEYWTRPMMRALQSWIANGGRLMYLGGNGFYWVTGVAEDAPHIVEVRRGYSGTRSWDSKPGELYLSTTGDLGGLWRHAGYFPQALVGVGFTAEGWGMACGYRRLEASYDGHGAKYFDGITGDTFGDFGHVMGGAVGDEVDRMDFALGTPENALRLATSTGLDNSYQLVHEDLLLTEIRTGGEEHPDVRSDIVVFDIGRGGRVFSVGSINYAGALAWNRYDNDVATLTNNVLEDFLGD